MPPVYVASPLGFSEPGRHYLAEVLHPRLAASGWSVLDPWADPTGTVTETLALPAGPARRDGLVQMSRTIGERNRALLAEAAAVLAVLDGPDVDSGTAAEVGWAAAHHTPVVGWRSDFRLADHEAAPVNLQVEDFVRVSGGCLVATLDEAIAALGGVLARHGARPAPASDRRPADFVVLGPRFDEALLYASAAHRQQARKGTAVPYLSHLLAVASLVLTHGGSEDQAIAALLHDTVEDCGTEHEPVIEERFGSAVLRMVGACTDVRIPAGAEKPDWHSRKEAYLRHLAGLDRGDPALLVSWADKVHNAESILADLETHGPALWDSFPGKTPEDHLWYYGQLAAFFDEALGGPLARRLRLTVDAIGERHRRSTAPASRSER